MKKIRRLLSLGLATSLVFAVIALSACAAGPVVRVFNWGEYIDEDIFKEFKKQTGIKVKYSTFDTNEAMYAKIAAGGTNYDIVIPSDYMVGRLIEEKMLEKIDFANVPNASLISDEYRNPAYDPTGEFSAAYMWGTVGLIYDSTVITEKPTSWGALFDPANRDDGILMVDNERDALGIALKYLGYSLNTESESELREALAVLTAQKPIVQQYTMDQVYDLMEGGEAAICAYYAGDFITMYEHNPKLAFSLPDEGANVFSDAMCILKGAENKANAEAFINFMCSTEIAERNQAVTGYVSANGEAAAALKAELDGDFLEVLFPSEEVLAICEPFYNLPKATRDLYVALWNQLKG
ncbi:MAG: ABC transporter substrate-binding protein [Oscillospiraceae bacterium]|jgi:spermidine/putrescine transport system substrate-binding protein|nr:ABC transporter substrate-binding protein [Oscillospiraceae bacterium]